MKIMKCSIILLILLAPFTAHAYTVSLAIDQTLADDVFGFDFTVSSDIPGSLSNATGGSAIPDGGSWFTSFGSSRSLGTAFLDPLTPLSAYPGIILSWVVADGASFQLDDWILADVKGAVISTDYTMTPKINPATTFDGSDFLCTFHAVPIPPSVLLLLSGLFGLVGFRKRLSR